MPDPSDIRGLEVDEYSALPPRRRRNRLLLIGIDEYRHLPALEHPVRDCERLFEVLREHYGFNEEDLIKSLFNAEATRQLMYDELYRLRGDDGEPVLSADDNLVLVFAGHGYLDERSGRGYWVPVDAPAVKSSPDLDTVMISVGHLVETLSQVRAHHILLIVDACFAGVFARMALDVPHDGNWNNPEEKPSRWALTAGRNQVVADESPFAKALQHVLLDNTELRISIKWIGSEIERRVSKTSNQLPWCGAIVPKEMEGGEFFFHRQTPAPNLAVLPWQTITAEELPQRLRHGSRAHLERLKKGRFQFLRIENLLLTNLTNPSFFETKVKAGSEETPLLQALIPLWRQEKPHAIVLGEGGMGKTVSLVQLWEDLLDKPTIPVFIALNEYNAAPAHEKSDFVLRYIARQCLGIEALTDDWKNAIWQVLESPLTDGAPAVLLLLDGFNEITVEKTELLLQLNKIAEQTAGVQLVTTSRYVEIQHFTWANRSEILELIPLASAQIEDYLRQSGQPQPENPELLQLFGNPMMLTLYTGSSSIGLRYHDDSRYRWLPVTTQGELLWNFHEAQLARFIEDVPHDVQEQVWLSFLLRHLLPYIAFRMEKEGRFFIHTRRADNPAFNIKSVIEDAYREWHTENFTDTYPLFEGKRKSLGFGILPDDLDGVQERYVRIRQYLVEKLHLLVAEEGVLRFVHQNFRDFLAACHLKNAAEMALVRKELPEEWKERVLPVYLRRVIGEMEGEQYFDFQTTSHSPSLHVKLSTNIPALLLDMCRGQFPSLSIKNNSPINTVTQYFNKIKAALLNDKFFSSQYGSAYNNDIGFIIYNIVLLYYEVRKTLASANLSQLDLRLIPFNNLFLSKKLYDNYFSAIFSGSLLTGNQFFYQGHIGAANAASYSSDGKKILTCANDATVKEWSTETGACISIIKSLSGWVASACYNSNGEKILICAGWDLVEWSTITGKRLNLFPHIGSMRGASYSPDGDKVLTFSMALDGNIQEWSIITGKRLSVFQGHERWVTCAKYSPNGKKALSASEDGTIKEWILETGDCLHTIVGHTSCIKSICYSPDGKKALSASEDGTIKEWLLANGSCIQTIQQYSICVNSICYSPDGKKALSASKDGTLKEWLLATGELIHTINGHSSSVLDACYSPDGKKILSTSEDGTIKEWLIEADICLQIFQGRYDYFNSARYNIEGQKILTTSADGTLKEWSANTGICLNSLIVNHKGLWGACYNKSSNKALLLSMDGEVEEWALETGRLLNVIHEKSEKTKLALYNEDDSAVYISFHDGTAIKWSSSTCSIIDIYDDNEWDKIHSDVYSHGRYTWGVEPYLEKNGNVLTTKIGRRIRKYVNDYGLYVQSVDFRHLHPDSVFTDEEKERLRRYGAIFDDEDERRWKEAVADAYGDFA